MHRKLGRGYHLILHIRGGKYLNCILIFVAYSVIILGLRPGDRHCKHYGVPIYNANTIAVNRQETNIYTLRNMIASGQSVPHYPFGLRVGECHCKHYGRDQGGPHDGGVAGSGQSVGVGGTIGSLTLTCFCCRGQCGVQVGWRWAKEGQGDLKGLADNRY